MPNSGDYLLDNEGQADHDQREDLLDRLFFPQGRQAMKSSAAAIAQVVVKSETGSLRLSINQQPKATRPDSLLPASLRQESETTESQQPTLNPDDIETEGEA